MSPTPTPVPLWRRLLWVGLGAGTVIAAVVLARLITPDVPTYVDDDGYEYSQGGLFGNLFTTLAWFFVSWTGLMIAATWLARSRRDHAGAYPYLGRASLVVLGPVVLVTLLVGLRSFRTALGLDFLIFGW